MLVVDKINEIAREIHRLAGYEVPEGHDFVSTSNPREVRAFLQAVAAWELMMGDTPSLEEDWPD